MKPSRRDGVSIPTISIMYQNNLLSAVAQNRVCTAIGLKSVAGNEVVLLAKAAGYDSILIDLEHSPFSIRDVSNLCSASLLARITPFVRVPYQCGNGFVARILDAGAMGIVFPRIDSVEAAENAVASAKYPPAGQRPLTAALPQFDFHRIPAGDVTKQIDRNGSTVFVVVDNKQCLERIDAVASVKGVDVILLGATDLSLDLGVLGDWESATFQSALNTTAAAAHRAGKVFGVIGLYTRPDVCKRAVNEFGARFLLGQLDIGLLAGAMRDNMDQLRDVIGAAN